LIHLAREALCSVSLEVPPLLPEGERRDNHAQGDERPRRFFCPAQALRA